MTKPNSFTRRSLAAAEYVLALHQPDDRVAVVVRNRFREQTIQRITRAEDVAHPSFQDWLKEQNHRGADIFVGMNPLRANSFARTKESVREIRHVYLDLDEDAQASLRAIRTDGSTPMPNFVLDTSPTKTK
jgi:RepB DNA-primase from phage plasmid